MIHSVVYTVFDNTTDRHIAVDATAKECAKAMGVRVESVYSLYQLSKKQMSKRWIISSRDRRIAEISNKENDMTLGQKIRYHRIEKKMTQKQIADMIGVSPNAITYYENDKCEPSFFAVTCIADVLGLSLDYLAGREKGGKKNV